MKNNKVTLKAVIVISLLTMLISPEVLAWSRGGHGGHGGRYYYRGNRWYRSDAFWFDAGVTALTLGAIASSLPPRHETVIVQGEPYYYSNNVYFRQCPSGYVVVQPPVVTQEVVTVPAPSTAVMTMPVTQTVPVMASPQMQVPSSDAVVINVPNSSGGYNAVRLTKRGNGYVGPQGEFYQENPTVDQLKALYGK